MVVTEIEVTIGKTINTGNYENYRPEVRMRATLDETDYVGGVFEELHGLVLDALSTMIEKDLRL
jgi:hypothetical protein